MNFSLFDLFWIFIIISSLIPALQKKLLEGNRHRVMRQLEKKRNSRLITLIHRQEVISFLGIGFRRYIDIEDSEALLRAIRLTPKDMPIDIILHTPGGLVLAAEQIAHALIRHPGSGHRLHPPLCHVRRNSHRPGRRSDSDGRERRPGAR